MVIPYRTRRFLKSLAVFLLALVLWFWYPLHKKQVENNSAALKKQRES